jgi:hypothetical protein
MIDVAHLKKDFDAKKLNLGSFKFDSGYDKDADVKEPEWEPKKDMMLNMSENSF